MTLFLIRREVAEDEDRVFSAHLHDLQTQDYEHTQIVDCHIGRLGPRNEREFTLLAPSEELLADPPDSGFEAGIFLWAGVSALVIAALLIAWFADALAEAAVLLGPWT